MSSTLQLKPLSTLKALCTLSTFNLLATLQHQEYFDLCANTVVNHSLLPTITLTILRTALLHTLIILTTCFITFTLLNLVLLQLYNTTITLGDFNVNLSSIGSLTSHYLQSILINLGNKGINPHESFTSQRRIPYFRPVTVK
jgi:hypothetical protein